MQSYQMGRAANSDGIVPLRRFLPSSKYSGTKRLINSVGIDPVRLLSAWSNIINPGIEESAVWRLNLRALWSPRLVVLSLPKTTVEGV